MCVYLKDPLQIKHYCCFSLYCDYVSLRDASFTTTIINDTSSANPYQAFVFLLLLESILLSESLLSGMI